MIINPIIPIPVMAIICIALLFFKRKGVLPYIMQIAIIALLFVINLRFMVYDHDVPTSVYPVDVLFVVDNTISMLAEDYNGDERRIDAVKDDVQYIMEEFSGARFSVLSFGNEARRMVPYTEDTNIIMQAMKSLNGQSTYYAKGTSFEDVVAKMKRALDTENHHRQVVFFISDGEITGKGKRPSFKELEKYIDDGLVLGYGTDNGGYMRAQKYAGDEEELQYVTTWDKNYNQVKAVSYIDEGNLKDMADDMGIGYVHMKKQNSADNELEKIKAKSGEPVESDTTDGYKDIYYWFVLPLIILLIIDFFYCKKKLDV